MNLTPDCHDVSISVRRQFMNIGQMLLLVTKNAEILLWNLSMTTPLNRSVKRQNEFRKVYQKNWSLHITHNGKLTNRSRRQHGIHLLRPSISACCYGPWEQAKISKLNKTYSMNESKCSSSRAGHDVKNSLPLKCKFPSALFNFLFLLVFVFVPGRFRHKNPEQVHQGERTIPFQAPFWHRQRDHSVNQWV